MTFATNLRPNIGKSCASCKQVLMWTTCRNYIWFFGVKLFVLLLLFIIVRFILPKFVGESWMREGIVGRSTTRTCIFPQPKSRKRQHTECQTSSQEYDQFFLRSTNRISYLCLTLDHIICRNQWTVFRGCWKGIQLEWCYQSLAQFVEKVLLVAAHFSLIEIKTK